METKRATEIRETLAEHGVTATQFAGMLGVSRPYLCDILNGHRQGKPIRIRIEQKLAEVVAEAEAEMKANTDTDADTDAAPAPPAKRPVPRIRRL